MDNRNIIMVADHWRDVTDQLMADKSEFEKYLKFASGIYKYGFTDVALIYHQNPSASKVADIKTWNSIGRLVNKGEKGIMVFGKDNKCRYLFDVSQTNGKKEPAIWRMNSNLSERLVSSINEKENTSYQNLNELIAGSCITNIKQLRDDENLQIYDTLSDEQKRIYSRTIMSATRYIISNRCLLNKSDDIQLDTTLNLDGMSLIHSKKDFVQFCSLVHKAAKNTLLSFERELIEIIRKMKVEKNKAPEHPKPVENIEIGYTIPFSIGDTFDIDDVIYKVNTIDVQTTNVKLIDISSPAHTKSMSIDDLSLLYVQEQNREQAIYKAIDTVLGNDAPVIMGNTIVETTSVIPPLTDEKIIFDVLRNNDNRYERDTSINDFFNGNINSDQRTDYIMRAYRDGAFQFKIDGIDVGYEKTNKGLSVWKGTPDNKFEESTFSWNCVQAFISELVEKNEFLQQASINHFVDTIPKIKAQNYRFSEDDIVVGGAKTKYTANVEAIKTLKKIESENRNATSEEQSVMAKYSGWGGIPQAFDKRNDSWEKEYAELKDLLSNSEYSDARASTLTSFYTPPAITDSVYQALEQFGFKGGNVLEPSMGVGNFIAKMPKEMKDNSRVYGVELDSISGRIAQKLYPKENVQIKGFEKTNFNDNSFDVVLGNIPFGDYKVSDREYDKHNFKIHDYFAAKAVDKVKPGGIVAIVTSKFTMDKQNESARQYLAERCDLLGAVRLPDNAFKGNAGTTVTTDVLFFQKRDTQTIEVPDWVHMSETADGVPCNKYFVDNPDMILGKMEYDQRMKAKYGEESKTTTCSSTRTDLAEQLKEAISKINGQFRYTSPEKVNNKLTQMIPADPAVRNYTHTLVNGKLYRRENEVMVKVEETGIKLERLLGLHSVRQAAMAVINAQMENCTDTELQALQKTLNEVYDKFVSQFGYISDSANAKAFGEDDDYNTIRAFENLDKDTGKIIKAEIFFKRTITPEIEITAVDNPQEALQVSLDKLGRVDIEYMSKLSNIEPEKLISELGDSIYRNPAAIKENEQFSGYEDASEYLSGNIREKLDIAKQYAKKISSDYERNISALEKSLPKKIEANDISVRIGVNWIENEDYTKFMIEYAKASMYSHPLRRTPLGEYKIEHKGMDHSVNATSNFGTTRMNSYEIMENLLNNRDIVVRDRKEVDDKVTYVINQKETQLAKDKATKMKEAFKNWIWKDIDRREYYIDKYNRLYNSIKGREYDGSKQTFPGMNPAIKLRPHQKNAILRAKLGGNTLLAHCVGAGKSFEIDTSVMEKKRLGLINKACVVVPKHLTMQTALEWQKLYPHAKLLVSTPKDFEKDNRQQFIAKCVTGDYDGIIMSFNQFEKIPMSEAYKQKFVQKELDTVIDALASCDSNDRTSIKDLERTKRSLENKIDKLLHSKKDNSLTFEQLGFDYLVVDEAHNYKNCLVVSKMSNVAGVQTTGAAKSEDMLMKTQYLNEKYNYKNVLFATGTPVSNSMVELYSMKRYLRPDLMHKADIQTFDDWASNFGEVVSQLEMKPAGDGFRMKNRFSKFANIPELMQMYKEFADIQMQDMINLPGLPKMQTGKPIIVKAKPDELQLAYMKELGRRSEAIHSGSVNPKEDNMLKITHEARLLGLDSRCINRDFEPNPDSKVNQLVDNLERIRMETDKDKGIQIVFCDIAINEDAEHFSVYNAIKDELIKRGIPENEVCFAGDAKNDKERIAMFEQLRQGEKRIIIASTSKLGTGANIQNRIAAIHHLDIPWKPSDLEQQNGRGLRQGNMFKEVGIYHYVTENTFDAYMLGIITNKAKFISQVMTSKEPARTCDDVDEMVLTYAEMQAITSGNPLLKEKIILDNEVARLKMLESEYKKSLYDMQELSERRLPKELENTKILLEKAKIDLKTFSENRSVEDEFTIKIGNVEFTERTKAGDELEKSILKCATTNEKMDVGEYDGFKLSIEKDLMYNSFVSSPCKIALKGELTYIAEVSLNNNVGNIRRIENLALVQIPQRVKELEQKIESIQGNLTAAKEALDVKFEHADELVKAVERLAEVNHALGTDTIQDDMPVNDDDSIDNNNDVPDLEEKRNTLLSSKKFDISSLTEKQNTQEKELLKKDPPEQRKSRGL